MRPTLPLLLTLGLAIQSQAAVIDLAAGGFSVRSSVVVTATPEATWDALLDVAGWWHPGHSWSGDASRLELQPRPGGCLCERLDDGGVEHLRVVYVARPRLLRLRGALGPLQGLGLAGSLTLALDTIEDIGTRIQLDYRLGGHVEGGLDSLAPVVDAVLAEQLRRLAARVETGEPAPEPVRVGLETALGEIVIELDLARAPVSASRLLRLVESGRYDGAVFHRTVTPDNQPDAAVLIEVIQAGPPEQSSGGELPAIPLERTGQTGLSHLDGTVSFARLGPDTASSDIFICVGDQPELDFGGRRNPDGQGFAAFGRVVEGMDVVRRIHRSPVVGQRLQPPVRILRAHRLGPAGS